MRAVTMAAFLLGGALGLAPVAAQAPSAPAWQPALDRLAAARDELSSRLQAALSSLRTRVAAEQPDLLPKIDGQAPKPIPVGYGLIPRVDPDAPDKTGGDAPGERSYAIPVVADWTRGELDRTAALQARIATGQKPLGPLVDDYLLRRENFNRIDDHVKYHASWQPEAVHSAGFFAGRNGLLAAYRVWRSTAAPQDARDAARKRLESEIVSFSPSAGLHFDGSPGAQVMRVTIQTDVGDDAFLKALEEGVDRVWNQSAAMKTAGLRFEVKWKLVTPSELYPEGVPAKGAAIDVVKHLGRFPPGLVLTTGAAATQAYPNRAIVVGPVSITRHALGHEFSHLLGFTDGYLRAFDGSPDDPSGVTFWEITPFPDDLLADPGQGLVTPAMVERLRGGYAAAR